MICTSSTLFQLCEYMYIVFLVVLLQKFLIWTETYRGPGNGIMRLWLGPVPSLWLFKASAVEVGI